MRSKNIAKIQFKFLIERALSTGEPCTCEHVTMLQSFLLSFLCPFYLDAILRRSCLEDS